MERARERGESKGTWREQGNVERARERGESKGTWTLTVRLARLEVEYIRGIDGW